MATWIKITTVRSRSLLLWSCLLTSLCSDLISTAEAATLQLEFKYLAELTGNEVYWEKVENVRIGELIPHTHLISFMQQVMRVIKAARMPAGLASIFMR
jgi:endoplasmic reticulum Man9GlcNAc2 1,2-alpha-mannosidase